MVDDEPAILSLVKDVYLINATTRFVIPADGGSVS